jgi:hypothetical protein
VASETSVADGSLMTVRTARKRQRCTGPYPGEHSELTMGRLAEVAGHVATVAEKVAGHHLCLPWATVRFHGIDLDLNFYSRLWDLYWREVRPGARLRVTGRVDARKPRHLAIAVHEVALLSKSPGRG